MGHIKKNDLIVLTKKNNKQSLLTGEDTSLVKGTVLQVIEAKGFKHIYVKELTNNNYHTIYYGDFIKLEGFSNEKKY